MVDPPLSTKKNCWFRRSQRWLFWTFSKSSKRWKCSIHCVFKILRPQFKDSRVHFAINCAFKSCPRLLDKPYEGDILESQLNHQTKIFINDKHNNFLKDDTLFISKIFNWFKDDFNDNPLGFIKQYASEELKQNLDADRKNIKIRYLDYDWSLNR